jgi:H+/Cl- antiporter ClcA
VEVALSEKSASPVLGVQPRVPRTHWLEGGLVGVVTLGIFGGIAGHALCANSEVRQTCTGPTIRLAVLGAAGGFVTGALIGGQFPKRER